MLVWGSRGPRGPAYPTTPTSPMAQPGATTPGAVGGLGREGRNCWCRPRCALLGTQDPRVLSGQVGGVQAPAQPLLPRAGVQLLGHRALLRHLPAVPGLRRPHRLQLGPQRQGLGLPGMGGMGLRGGVPGTVGMGDLGLWGWGARGPGTVGWGAGTVGGAWDRGVGGPPGLRGGAE